MTLKIKILFGIRPYKRGQIRNSLCLMHIIVSIFCPFARSQAPETTK